MRRKAIEQWEDEEFRQKMLANRRDSTGDKNPFYGKHHTEETKERLRQQSIGRKPSEEARRKMSVSSTERWKNEEYRQLITSMVQGENNPHYGKKHTDEVKNRIGELNGIRIVQLDLEYNFITEYRSAQIAEKITGIKKASIRRCCNGQQKTAGGFKWMNKEDWNKLQNELEDINELQII